MKKLFLMSALAALSAFAGNLTETTSQDPKAVQSTMLSFALPNGETTVDLRYPLSLERLEGAFLSGSKTLKLERIRDLYGIPYIDHRTNDAEVTGGVITEGTTFDNYDEVFAGPLVTYDGGSTTYHTDKMTSSYVYRVDSDVIQWYRLNHQVGGMYGFGPCIYYSFASNALYLASVLDNPEKWTSLGPPGRFSYGNYYKYRQGYYPAIVDHVNGTTNFLHEVADSKNKYSSIIFAGVTMPTNLVKSVDGSTVPISFVPGHTVTNFAVWSTCSMCVTNTLLNATVGTSFSTNFNGDAILLPKDRIRISGTAMPTGHIIGIGKK